MEGAGKPAKAYKKTRGKVLISDLNGFEPSLIEKQKHSGNAITPAVLRLIQKGLSDGLDVVILNRTNRLNWYVENPEARKLDGYLESIRAYFPKGLKERISISTAHKYKGLEKTMVIVLDAIARNYPLIHSDWVFCRLLGDSPEKIIKEERRLFYVALTRAVETLVIITDGKSKSPFLEEIEQKLPLSEIKWADYPPVSGATTRLVVKISNQVDRGVQPTIAIRDLLKVKGYQWQSTGGQGWVKSFPLEGFCIEVIQAELWAEKADGVEVRIFDDTETLVSHYLIDSGNWHCLQGLAQVE
ncbi:hypothetical protein BH11VER1_BH11VER1_41350 [soil metagenome]